MQGVRCPVDPVAVQQRPENGCTTVPVLRVRNVCVLLANLVAVAVESLLRRGQDPQVGVVKCRLEGLRCFCVVSRREPDQPVDGRTVVTTSPASPP